MKESTKTNGLMQELRESFFGTAAKDIRTRTRLITLMGVLTALCIAVERLVYLPIGTNSRYSLTFVVIALTAIVLGGLKGAVVAALADILGSLIVYGSVCPLITVCVFLSALTFGMFLYSKRNAVRIVLAVFVDQLVCSLILKTGALAIWYNGGMNAYLAVFMTRMVQAAIMIPIEIAVLLILNGFFFGTAKRLVKDFIE